MAKVEKRQTVEERRKELEAQLAELDALETIENEIKELADRYKNYYNSEFRQSFYAGKEAEQAKNADGELLFTVNDDWHKYTQKELDEKGITEGITPFYHNRYEEREITLEEMNDWQKSRAIAYKRLADFFENINLDEVK